MSTKKGLLSYIHMMLTAQKSFRDQDEEVKIALGKYELPITFKGGIKKILREWR